MGKPQASHGHGVEFGFGRDGQAVVVKIAVSAAVISVVAGLVVVTPKLSEEARKSVDHYFDVQHQETIERLQAQVKIAEASARAEETRLKIEAKEKADKEAADIQAQRYQHQHDYAAQKQHDRHEAEMARTPGWNDETGARPEQAGAPRPPSPPPTSLASVPRFY